MDKSIFIKFKETLANFGLEYFKRFYGVYSGTCIDNADPDNLGRIKITCGQLYGNQKVDRWVVPRGTVAQRGAGIFWVPSAGDPVNISCINGDPRFPMWEWSNWVEGGVPSGAVPGNYAFITPGGHRIDLDDNNSKVTVTHPDGNKIILDASGVFVGKNNTYNLGKFLEDLLSLNETTTTATLLGAQPFLNATLYTQLKNELSNWIKTSE